MIALQYMSSMGDDNLVVDAARVSFDKQAENFGPRQNERLINFLAKEKHTAPFTHPTVSFRCEAPIFMARQLAKHQVGGTWNEVSRRYVKTSPEFWKPDFFRAAADDVKQGSSPDEHRRSDEFLEEYLDICIDAVAASATLFRCQSSSASTGSSSLKTCDETDTSGPSPASGRRSLMRSVFPFRCQSS